MTTMNLGTCCGSKPSVGLPAWLAAGGTGIDTAYDYQDQADIAKIIHGPDAPPREKLFITTKVPAGFGNQSDCDPDPDIPVRYIKENLKELQIDQVDLALLHRPCQASQTKDPVASNNALWKGMQKALEMGLVRAIGVSNYRTADLKALDQTVLPAVNQCRMGIAFPPGTWGLLPKGMAHDDDTIDYCQSKGILYESYQAMKGCPFTDSNLQKIAAKHNVTTSQVCLRWVLDRGCASATGTGADASKVAAYAKENLDVYSFTLAPEEVALLNKIQVPGKSDNDDKWCYLGNLVMNNCKVTSIFAVIVALFALIVFVKVIWAVVVKSDGDDGSDYKALVL